MAGRLQDKIAIITGAGSGIGRAIAERFASEGAKVVVAGQRLPRLEETVQRLRTNGGTAAAVRCDVADRAQVEHLMRAAVETYGRIDLLVNNAAKNRPERALTETVAEMEADW